MLERPTVSSGDWISIGKRIDPVMVNAVVCNVFDERIEVVYLDIRDRAINEDVVWTGTHWKFKDQGPSGGYADNYDRLTEYVSKLRRGRFR